MQGGQRSSVEQKIESQTIVEEFDIDHIEGGDDDDGDDDDDDLAKNKSTRNKDQNCQATDDNNKTQDAARQTNCKPIELRLLVRRREAGALIGKRGSNIKRLRETYRETSSFSIPDSGNGPERVVCIVSRSWQNSMEPILAEIAELLLEKSGQNEEQIELKLLIHSLHAGSLIGLGGQTIKKLRTDSKAAIKIFEMCCPSSSERICAVKSRPKTVVNALKMILDILGENPIGKQHTSKPYDALNFDLCTVDKYGGYLPDELAFLSASQSIGAMGRQRASTHQALRRQSIYSTLGNPAKHCTIDNEHGALRFHPYARRAPIQPAPIDQSGAREQMSPRGHLVSMGPSLAAHQSIVQQYLSRTAPISTFGWSHDMAAQTPAACHPSALLAALAACCSHEAAKPQALIPAELTESGACRCTSITNVAPLNIQRTLGSGQTNCCTTNQMLIEKYPKLVHVSADPHSSAPPNYSAVDSSKGAATATAVLQQQQQQLQQQQQQQQQPH